ncbi:hypothetical protein FisN_4Lh123 [Fistulifera solaris]|uniref:Uncharacterized protein n=1 Tax=Fistulifera solaris TaxID=1519565 RepID=A0A1Z5JZ45_FISSO|nr:hypothetical protein FisN_4Lh123 [Fistulifera solaris]|eukprot:GAX19300.1 hypothetical protein FisN_4Lh123 [Fistulifera solaris]
MSQVHSNQQNEAKDSVPTAHYPPMVSSSSPSSRFPSMQLNSIRGTTATTANVVEDKTRSIPKQQVQFCDYDQLAVINCHPESSSSRKNGPVLMEWKQVVFNENGKLFDVQTRKQSRGNPSLGLSVSSTCLDVLSTKVSATGLTTGALCLHSFDTGTVEYYHLPRNHRPATAVACHGGHQIAVGLMGNVTNNHHHPRASSMASGGMTTIGQGTNLPTGAQASDRDYGAFVWEPPRKTPVYKLSHQLGVTALHWLDASLLVGNRHQWQWYDLRQRQPVSVVNAKVSHLTSLSADANRNSHLVISSHQSIVQLWDTRRLATPVSEIKVSFPSGSNDEVTGLQVIPYSEQLFLLTDESLLEYNLNNTSRPVHVNTITSRSQRMVDFALYPFASAETGESEELTPNQRAVFQLFPNRVVAIVDENDNNQNRNYENSNQKKSTIQTLARQPLAPLAWSQRQLVHGFGRTLWADNNASNNKDIDDNLLTWKFTLQPMHNIELLRNHPPQNSQLSQERHDALLRVWHWLERVEDMEESKPINHAGVSDSLLFNKDTSSEMQSFSEELGCPIFESKDRLDVLDNCGWAGKYDLFNVLGQCEAMQAYERAAALAIWHGDLGAAVDTLQRGAQVLRDSADSCEKNSAYAELLDLAAISVAGYRGDFESAKSSVWRRTCANLLKRRGFEETRAAYVKSALRFLIALDNQQVVHDATLSLADRVAFCCRFAEQSDLKKFLENTINHCKETGNIEGVTITGISKDGIEIIQAYVDRYADVATAAIITSRVILPPEWTTERRVCTEWLESFRSILNSCQMWQTRAIFDVDRSELLRRFKARLMPALSNSRRAIPMRRSKGPDPDVHVAIPSQLDARCNYCNSSLGLKNQDGAPNQWLSKMKPVLSCCPTCRKPLPRCSICMLSLGVLNPFVELTKDRSKNADSQSLGSLPFAEWFTWCMRCKHGGHAHHLVGWFSKHNVCPVSDCDCNCQFDGSS